MLPYIEALISNTSAFISLANALATVVFPIPGGPFKIKLGTVSDLTMFVNSVFNLSGNTQLLMF
jgi:hypothetical protein